MRSVLTRSEVRGFLQHHRLAVVATIGGAGGPEAALVGIAVTPDLELVFDTDRASRKCANLLADPRVAAVIGWQGEVTVQYEEIADLATGAELERCLDSYFAAWPDGRARRYWPGIVYVRVRPRWIRYSDFGRTPADIAQMDFS